MFTGRTLGWGVLAHGHKYLPSPSDPTQPLTFTQEQIDITCEWYELDDEGEFLRRRGALEMPKGWGKSPFAAFLAIEELVGPVLFDGWDPTAKGGARGHAWSYPVVEIAAVSEDQTDNTYSAIFGMLTANDNAAAIALGIDIGRSRVYLVGRPGVMRAVTASAVSREGARLTFAIMDETHLWTRANSGIRLAGVIRRNLSKMGGRSIETTNAPIIGATKTVAEESEASLDVMHYARRPAKEPDPTWSDERLISALDEAYGDATWIDRKRLVAEIRDPATNWDDALRFYFNWRTAGMSRAVDPRVWDALIAQIVIAAGIYIGLGFDGSISRDATALVACTRGGFSWPIHIWERPEGAPKDWRIPRAEVHDAVSDTFARYKVGLMLADPPKWETEVEGWAIKYGEEEVLAFDTFQPRRMAPAVDRWLTAIREGTHTHSGDERLSRHVKAAHLRKVRVDADENDGRSMYVLEKGDDKAWIDGAVADVLAYEAAMTMPPPKETKKGGWAFSG